MPAVLTLLHFARGAAPALCAQRQCSHTFAAAAALKPTGAPARRQAPTATSSMPQPIVIPPKAQHSGSVIMLHGLGDSGAGWADIAQLFSGSLPHVKFIFPSAAARPITLNGGMRMPGWFDLTSIDKIDAAEDEAGLEESAKLVEGLVQSEHDAGIDRVVVAGFSQGGALALLLLRSRLRLAGCVGLSTWLPLAEAGMVLSDEQKNTPVFMAHGTADQVVKYDYGQLSYEKLKAAGADISFMPITGMGHEARPEELAELESFLGQVFIC